MSLENDLDNESIHINQIMEAEQQFREINKIDNTLRTREVLL